MTTTAALCSSGFDPFHHSAILRDQKIKGDSGMSHSATTEWPCVTWPLELAPHGWDPHLIKAGVVSSKREKVSILAGPNANRLQSCPGASLAVPALGPRVVLYPHYALHPCPTASSCSWHGSSLTDTANVALCPWFYIPK